MNIAQKIGAGLLVAAGIFGLLGWFYPAWIALGVTGVITLGCAIRNELGIPTRTVSQWIQGLTSNKTVDYTIGIAIMAIAVWQHFSVVIPSDASQFEQGMMTAFWPLIGGLDLHFFASD